MAIEKAPQRSYEAPDPERILQDALAMSAADRKVLVAALLNSLEPGNKESVAPEAWEAAWSAEIKRRVDNLEAGRTRLYSHDEVMADLEACLR